MLAPVSVVAQFDTAFLAQETDWAPAAWIGGSNMLRTGKLCACVCLCVFVCAPMCVRECICGINICECVFVLVVG